MQKTQHKCTEDPILHHTYKEGPLRRENGRAKEAITKNQHLGPPVNRPEEGAPGGVPPGVGRPLGSAEPGQAPVQVHFEEE